jgi:hypothetical protein
VRWLILVLLAGCHFGWSSYQGVRPRPNQSVKVVVVADDASKDLTRQVLAKDPRATVVEIDPALAATGREAGCKWAVEQQADYYIVGTVGTKFGSTYVCTKRGGSILDKTEGPCIEGHAENEHTTATFTLETLDAETSKPEAIAQMTQSALTQARAFPDQIELDASGAVDAPDGYYALYRGREFRGFVAREAASFRSLHCCDTPGPGDRLVARGKRKLLETAINFTGGSFQYDGERVLAGGMGAHVRYYPLDAGFRFGFGFDLVGTPSAKANSFLFFPEIGWGFRPSSAISLSANASVGWARGRQVHMERLAGSYTWLAGANLRVITFFTKWWYLGADVGYVHSGEFGMWDGDGAGMARPMSVRSPLGRIWAGFDL